MVWRLFGRSTSGPTTSSVSPGDGTTSASLSPTRGWAAPAELCREMLHAVEMSPTHPEARQQVAAILRRLDEALAATSDAPPPSGSSEGIDDDEHDVSAIDRAASREGGRALVAALLEADVPARLAARIDELCFEARKDATRLFIAIFRAASPLAGVDALVGYFGAHPSIARCLLDGCGRDGVFYHFSQMLRSCARYPESVEVLVNHGALERLIDLACCPSFDISSEAFSSLRELLLAHKAVSATYLAANFETFFEKYHTLLHSDRDYAARRQALRLLGDVLLSRELLQVMLAYIGNDNFLQIHMNLLRNESKTIQAEAFHVFKVFAANPSKPYRVLAILHRNRDRLLELLEVLLIGRRYEGSKPTTFDDDVEAVMDVLRELEGPQRMPRRGVGSGPPLTLGATAARNPDAALRQLACSVVEAS